MNVTKPIAKKSVSLPEELFWAGNKRAAAQNRSFSNYVQTLVLADLAKEVQSQPQSQPQPPPEPVAA